MNHSCCLSVGLFIFTHKYGCLFYYFKITQNVSLRINFLDSPIGKDDLTIKIAPSFSTLTPV